MAAAFLSGNFLYLQERRRTHCAHHSAVSFFLPGEKVLNLTGVFFSAPTRSKGPPSI